MDFWLANQSALGGGQVTTNWIWEVLNGVGADGVGVIFPFLLSPFFTHFSPFSSHFSASPKGQGQTRAEVKSLQIWEVLNGVGVDGVGVIFPFVHAFFPFFFAFFRFFFRFSLLLLKDKGKQHQFTAKMGNFTPTPSAPRPRLQNFPTNDWKLSCGGAKGMLGRGGPIFPTLTCAWSSEVCIRPTPSCASATSLLVLCPQRPLAPSPKHFYGPD